MFERAVKDYVKRSQNCKGVEVTYAKAEARREFLKSVQEDNTEDCKNCDISQVLILYIVMISKKMLLGVGNTHLVDPWGQGCQAS